MGPLAHMPALDVMWVSFYCIGFMILSVGLIYLGTAIKFQMVFYVQS